jgi:hypothetical protein
MTMTDTTSTDPESAAEGARRARVTAFTFAKQAPHLTGQMRAAGWTSETPIVVAEPDNTVTSLMAQLADCRPAGRAMVAVADQQPGRWLLCMVDTPTVADIPITTEGA